MNQVKLNNGNCYEILHAKGGTKSIQDRHRRTVEIQMKRDLYSFSQIDKDFNPDNTIRIELINETETYIHEGYGIRAELATKPCLVTPSTPTNPAVTEERLCITLAELTYEEMQIKQMRDTLDTMVLSTLEGGNA